MNYAMRRDVLGDILLLILHCKTVKLLYSVQSNFMGKIKYPTEWPVARQDTTKKWIYYQPGTVPKDAESALLLSTRASVHNGRS
jgi:hypothetical protein